MVLQISDNVRQELIKTVPSSIFDEITCFVFFDNHPRDDKLIDVTICNSAGEIVEYYKREVVCSLQLTASSRSTEIQLLRNSSCELFYLVVAQTEVFILSRKEKLCLHQRVSNVDKYFIEDQACRGQAYLKIIRNDDAVPMVFDNNFENVEGVAVRDGQTDDSVPLLAQLMRKLTEAKYSVQCNEKTLGELLSLRQKSALEWYSQIHSNNEGAMCQVGSKATKGFTPTIKTQKPLVKLCNGKIIIVLTLAHNFDEALEEVHIILHGTSKLSIVYTTKLFEEIKNPPFWKEKSTKSTKSATQIAITAVVDFDEIKHVLTNRIEFNGALFYKKSGKEYLVPFEHVFVSGEEISSPQFDALSSDSLDEITFLSILASTIKTEMVFRHIRKIEETSIDMAKLFCAHLHMEPLQNSKDIILYRSSPYHALNGVMLQFERNCNNKDFYNVAVYTRSPSQVTTLMYLVHTTIPHQIIMTTKSQRITAKKDELSRYNESLVTESSKFNYVAYGSAIVNQSNTLLEYLDNCMMKMSGKNPDKIGKEIDLYAPGSSSYKEFRQNMLDEAAKGIKGFMSGELESESMEIG